MPERAHEPSRAAGTRLCSSVHACIITHHACVLCPACGRSRPWLPPRRSGSSSLRRRRILVWPGPIIRRVRAAVQGQSQDESSGHYSITQVAIASARLSVATYLHVVMYVVRFRRFVYSISRRCRALWRHSYAPSVEIATPLRYISKLFQRRGSIYTRRQDSTYKNYDNPTKSCLRSGQKWSALGEIVTGWLPARQQVRVFTGVCRQMVGTAGEGQTEPVPWGRQGSHGHHHDELPFPRSFFAAPVPCLMSPPAPAPAATDKQTSEADAKPQTHGKPLPIPCLFHGVGAAASASCQVLPCPARMYPWGWELPELLQAGSRSGLLHSKSTRALLILRHLCIYPQPD
jgi:hypothetical protein